MHFDASFTDSLSIGIFWRELATLAKQAAVFTLECLLFRARQSRTPLPVEMCPKPLVSFNPKALFRFSRQRVVLDFFSLWYDAISCLGNCSEARRIEATPEVLRANFKAQGFGRCHAKHGLGRNAFPAVQDHIVIGRFAKGLTRLSCDEPFHGAPNVVCAHFLQRGRRQPLGIAIRDISLAVAKNPHNPAFRDVGGK